MKAAEIKDVRLGDQQVSRIMLGDTVVFERRDKYLIVRPEILWIVDDSVYTVDVLSNTDWTVQ